MTTPLSQPTPPFVPTAPLGKQAVSSMFVRAHEWLRRSVQPASCLAAILIPLVAFQAIAEPASIQFHDVSSQAGLISTPTMKYGGPCVADVNGDGRYDFLLGNHDQTPIQFFLAQDDGTYKAQPNIFYREDVHGLAAGDYDRDGDLDVLISLGGGNATDPKPSRLLRFDDGRFTDVTVQAGVSKLGARGRSVRWVDLDNDGHLDFIQINAAPAKSETSPRNIVFKNLGDATFEYVPCPEFETIEAEKGLITDFDGDHVPDLITFSPSAPAGFWRGNGDFSFTEVTAAVLPGSLQELDRVTAVAEADIDGDGDMDYYLARGLSGVQVSRNNIDFDESTGRLDIRDEGYEGRDGVSFETHGAQVDLLAFTHFPRPTHPGPIPVFLGRDKTLIPTPTGRIRWVGGKIAEGFPEELNATGWYLGYLGDEKWRLEWLLDGDHAWMIGASLLKVRSVHPDWTPLDTSVPDVLIRNDNGRFVDLSDRLPRETRDNNQGVAAGDFNNDGHLDFFVFRFGEIKKRIPDVMLLNEGKATFTARLDHGATDLNEDAHGDMGSAFDFDLDGDVDLLGGDDDNGTWHLFQNRLKEDSTGSGNANHLLVRVGYADSGVDPAGAVVQVTTAAHTQTLRVGAGSTAFSQCLLDTAHFGLGDEGAVALVKVRWRDGSEASLADVEVNQLITLGRNAGER